MVWLWILIAIAVVLLGAWLIGRRWTGSDAATRVDKTRGQHQTYPDSGWHP